MNGLQATRRTWVYRIRCLSSLLLLAGVAAACGGDRQVARGGQAVIGWGADMEFANPLISQGDLDATINPILYRPLLSPEWSDGWIVYRTAEEHPLALARSYEFFGPDNASLRYRLVSDATWSDGRPITAHDAAWTLEAQGNPALASPRQDYNREIRQILVEDDSTMVIHFTRQYPEMLFHTAGAVSPRHVYADSDLSQMRSHPATTDPSQNGVFSGPFRLTQWIRGQRLVLERNERFEPQAILDRLVFRVIPEEATRLIELQTGNVDIVLLPFQYVEQVRATGNIRIESQENRSYEYISYNPRAHPFLADREIRRALGMAIDVPALIQGLDMGEFARQAGGPYPPIFRLYDPESQAPLPFDTAAASRILTDKGWIVGPSGVRMREGVPLRFALLTNAENRRRVDIAQIIEQQWRRIGVEARIQTLEFNTVIERVTGREFEVRIGGWGVGLSQDFLYQLFGDPDLPFNYVSYDNAEVQRLMAIALEQPTEEAAAPYWRQVAALIVEDQPYTFLYYYDRPWGINNRLRGTRIDPLGEIQDTWEWHIEE